MRNWGRNYVYLISEKPPKLDEKIKRKTGGLIDEKPPKLNKKTREKTDHLLFCKG